MQPVAGDGQHTKVPRNNVKAFSFFVALDRLEFKSIQNFGSEIPDSAGPNEAEVQSPRQPPEHHSGDVTRRQRQLQRRLKDTASPWTERG